MNMDVLAVGEHRQRCGEEVVNDASDEGTAGIACWMEGGGQQESQEPAAATHKSLAD